MEPDYRQALRYALGERRLWAAGLLAALTLSEAWWVIYGWGPEYLGERWKGAFAGRLGDAGSLAVFLAVALAAFVVLKATGYLGEMVLIRQVAQGVRSEMPWFTEAFSASRGRYIHLAAALLPRDALRALLIYLPVPLLALWNRWDPRLDHLLLYVALFAAWFALLAAADFLVGVTAALAARGALLERQGMREAWRRGWSLLRRHAVRCLAAWLQVLAADLAFLVLAWPLSALVPWGAGMASGLLRAAPLRWLVHGAAYAVLAAFLVGGQTAVQCYRSSLWTLTYIRLVETGDNPPTRR